jgi:hypothetical protein
LWANSFREGQRNVADVCADVVNRVAGGDVSANCFLQMRLIRAQEITEFFSRGHIHLVSASQAPENFSRLKFFAEQEDDAGFGSMAKSGHELLACITAALKAATAAYLFGFDYGANERNEAHRFAKRNYWLAIELVNELQLLSIRRPYGQDHAPAFAEL